MITLHSTATPADMAMPNDDPLAWLPMNVAPLTHAPMIASRPMTLSTSVSVLRARAARTTISIAKSSSSVPSTACTASAAGPCATAAPNPARIPLPLSAAGIVANRFTHIPRAY